MPSSSKRFEYRIAVEREGRLTADGASPLEIEEAWSPDHLLLAALARCTIKSLRHHAERAEIRVAASAEAAGAVAKRASDDLFAFVEISCALDVELDPEPGADDLKALLLSAERDCFVGSSLSLEPSYRWRVNGRDVPVVDPAAAAAETSGAG